MLNPDFKRTQSHGNAFKGNDQQLLGMGTVWPMTAPTTAPSARYLAGGGLVFAVLIESSGQQPF
jgi:hypothetical protein